MKVWAVLLLASLAGCGQAETKKTHKQPLAECITGSVTSSGWSQYKCVPDDGKFGHWELDTEATALLRQEEKSREALATAFTSRVLTDDEFNEVLGQGPHLFVPMGQPYFQADIDQQFLTALQIQRELRLIAEDKKKHSN